MSEVRRMVVQATNLNTGGGRTILIAFLEAAIAHLPEGWQISCFVNHEDELPISPRLKFIRPQMPKGPWGNRIWFETIGLQRQLGNEPIDLLISLQGSMPRVRAKLSAVYVHNILPFARWSLRSIAQVPIFFVRSVFYDLLYRFTLHRCDVLIVQQQAYVGELQRRYGYKKTIVARPVARSGAVARPFAVGKAPFRILYPATALPVKNIEMLGEALRVLEREEPGVFKVRLTLDGSESSYAASLKLRYADLPALEFAGPVPYANMGEIYRTADLLVYPSLIESWGLPLSEATAAELPILAADLPYAHETIGHYNGVSFFSPSQPESLAKLILDLWRGKLSLTGNNEISVSGLYADSWAMLVGHLVGPLQSNH